MESLALKEEAYAVEELFLAFARFAQEYWIVKSLPSFDDERWKYFIELVDAELKLPPAFAFDFCMRPSKVNGRQEIVLREYDNILYAFSLAADIDHVTGRMKFKEESDFGVSLCRRFDNFLEQMVILGWRIDGFYQFE